MGFTYAGVPLVEPKSALESCLRADPPLPTDWLGLANQYRNPLGCASGTGHVLMTRGHLAEIDLSGEHDLVMRLGDPEVSGAGVASEVTYKNLHIVSARCITPGLRGDPAACYLVELADRRRLAMNSAIDRAYNMRSIPGGGSFFSATLNPDTESPWTWEQMCENIWDAVALLGDYPELPFTPDGTPYGFDFYGAGALDALAEVLDRLSCALSYDPSTGLFSIIQIGADDSTVDSALAGADRLRMLDSDWVEPNLARYPESLRVLFQKQLAVPDASGASPWLAILAADPDGAPEGVLEGTTVSLRDDMPALYDSDGNLVNAAELLARTQERATDYFRRLRLDRLDRTYALPLPTAGLRPGARVSDARHGDRGFGLVTQVRTGRMPMMAARELQLGQSLQIQEPQVGLWVVTDVCPTIEDGVVTSITVERTLIFLPPNSVSITECEDNPDDCCEESGSEPGSLDAALIACCPDPLPTTWCLTFNTARDSLGGMAGTGGLTHLVGTSLEMTYDPAIDGFGSESHPPGWVSEPFAPDADEECDEVRLAITCSGPGFGNVFGCFVLFGSPPDNFGPQFVFGGCNRPLLLGGLLFSSSFTVTGCPDIDFGLVEFSIVEGECEEGGGSSISTDCCSSGLPSTLYLTISGGTGCDCLHGTYALTWYGTVWRYTSTALCGGTRLVGFLLQCQGGQWRLDAACYETIYAHPTDGFQSATALLPATCTLPLDFGEMTLACTPGPAPGPCDFCCDDGSTFDAVVSV